MSSTIVGVNNPEDLLKDAAPAALSDWINADWNTQPGSVARFPTSGTHRFKRAVEAAAATFARPIVDRAVMLTHDAETALKQKHPGVALKHGETAMLLMDSVRNVGRSLHTHKQWDAAVDARFDASDALIKQGNDAAISLALADLPTLPPAVPDGSTFETMGDLRNALQTWAPSDHRDPIGTLWNGGNVFDLPFKARIRRDGFSTVGITSKSAVVRFAIEKGKGKGARDTLIVICIPLYRAIGAKLTAYGLAQKYNWRLRATPMTSNAGVYAKVAVVAQRGGYGVQTEAVGDFYTGAPITYRVRDIRSAVRALGGYDNENRIALLFALTDAGYKRIEDRQTSGMKSAPVRAVAQRDSDQLTQLWTPGE